MTPLRMLFVCNEQPYPAEHGGRADVWRRLLSMREVGIETMLVFWMGDSAALQPSAAELEVIRAGCARLHPFVIRRDPLSRARRLWHMRTLHPHVASRMLDAGALARLVEATRAFAPHAVWLESINGAPTARHVAEALSVPLFVRSANVEHLYSRRQAELATRFTDRIRWGLNVGRLERLEYSTLRAARRFFDISITDLAWWASRGIAHGDWLPTLIDPTLAARLTAPLAPCETTHDVGYLGNLRTPNNVHGLLWFLEQVVPKLREGRRGLKAFVAGSRPVPEIITACAQARVELIADPPDAVPVLRRARVLVNPVFFGSGVNVKSIDMLFSPARLVSTPQGVAGLPANVCEQFSVHAEPDAFAAATLAALREGPARISDGRRAAQSLFRIEAMRVLRERLVELTRSAPRSVGEEA